MIRSIIYEITLLLLFCSDSEEYSYEFQSIQLMGSILFILCLVASEGEFHLLHKLSALNFRNQSKTGISRVR